MRMGGLCQDNTDDSVENTPQGCKEEEKTCKAGQTVAGQDKTGERLKKKLRQRHSEWLEERKKIKQGNANEARLTEIPIVFRPCMARCSLMHIQQAQRLRRVQVRLHRQPEGRIEHELHRLVEERDSR